MCVNMVGIRSAAEWVRGAHDHLSLCIWEGWTWISVCGCASRQTVCHSGVILGSNRKTVLVLKLKPQTVLLAGLEF